MDRGGVSPLTIGGRYEYGIAAAENMISGSSWPYQAPAAAAGPTGLLLTFRLSLGPHSQKAGI